MIKDGRSAGWGSLCVEGGAASERDACDTEETISHGPEGAPMRVAALERPRSGYDLGHRPSLSYSVRAEGAHHQWRKVPPGELSIAPVADERLCRVTGLVEAS